MMVKIFKTVIKRNAAIILKHHTVSGQVVMVHSVTKMKAPETLR